MFLFAISSEESKKQCIVENTNNQFEIKINYIENHTAQISVYSNEYGEQESFILIKDISNCNIKWKLNYDYQIQQFDTTIYRNKHYLYIYVDANAILDFDNDIVFTMSEYVNGYSKLEIIEIRLEH